MGLHLVRVQSRLARSKARGFWRWYRAQDEEVPCGQPLEAGVRAAAPEFTQQPAASHG